MFCAIGLALAAHAFSPPIRFVDVTDEVGLGGLSAARLAFVDLNANGRPDAVIDRHRVFINTVDAGAKYGFRFVEVPSAGLPMPQAGDSVVFADLDNDGFVDAIIARSLDIHRDGFEPPPEPARTAWLKGNGDGTFGEARIIEAAKPATTCAIAIGDVNLDGRLDLYLGNWYTRYGRSLEAFTNDLLLQAGEAAQVSFVRQPLAEDAHEFDDERDAAGRPTYGAIIGHLVLRAPHEPHKLHRAPQPDADRRPHLLELNYGRRANRLWMIDGELPSSAPAGRDVGVETRIDGDDIRHGRHPDWLKIIAQRDSRFDRPDEKPFRSHGNTFDAAIGDVNNNGMFDVFLAEITHGWAGDSSDRSRLLMSAQRKADPLTIFEPSRHSFDRIPEIPPREEWPDGWFPRWNHGDLFCEFADLDNDGLLDVIISSGDYPDPPPHDQRLRIFRQQVDGSFTDVTAGSGIDHVGSQQISMGDVDGDGQVDILIGQSFTRFTPDMVQAAGGVPRLRLFLNRTFAPGIAAVEHDHVDDAASSRFPARVPNAITLSLIGDPALGISHDALGAIVHMHTSAPGRERYQSRQLISIGGHAGKQHQFLVHLGLGAAEQADRIEITWPSATERTTILRDVAPGHYVVSPDP